ncbi:MAG: MBL fold metallo-hydrolase, partial [Verrucomicrobiota bacterium]
AHYAGKNQYEGVARMTGWAEAFARKTRGYRPFDLHRTLDADVDWRLPLDLKVVPLPGHTRGHLGLYWARKKWLFSGDLFASFRRLSHLPPVFFNENTKEARASIGRALELDLAGVLPNHCDQATPAEHFERLRRIGS